MRANEITLTIPPDDAFHAVAELVITGLASGRDATVEGLEDLRIALDALLARSEARQELTVSVRMDDGELTTEVGPLGEVAEADVTKGGKADIGLGRILDAVVDRWELQDRPDGRWVELKKRFGSGAW